MSVYRSSRVPVCNRCGSDLHGRLARTINRERKGRKIEVDIFRCRCGGSRRITRLAREVSG